MTPSNTQTRAASSAVSGTVVVSSDTVTRVCIADGCDRPPKARRLCSKHYQSARADGMPILDRPNWHRMSDFDPDAMTATCSVCGPGPAQMFEARPACARKIIIAKARNSKSYRRRRRDYGFATVEDLMGWMEAEGSRCGICLVSLTPATARIDHDHDCCPTRPTCGKCVRGLLCQRCNAGLGLLGDNEQGLLTAIDYLRRPRPRP